MEKEYQPSYPGSLDAMRKTRNKSGLVGVHRTIYKCTKNMVHTITLFGKRISQ